MIVMKLASFDDNVAGFADKVMAKADLLTNKHDNEVKELFRLKKSFKRLLKRRNLPFDTQVTKKSPAEQPIEHFSDIAVKATKRSYQERRQSFGETEA